MLKTFSIIGKSSDYQTKVCMIITVKVSCNLIFLKLGEVSLDWYENDGNDEVNYIEKPICVLIPGILAASQDSYVKTLILKGNSIGMHCCALNNRGKGDGTILKTPKLFSSADSHEDLEFVLNNLRIENPDRRIYSVGLSFGSIILGKYLAKAGDKAVVDGCMLISTIFDFFSACTSIENINDWANMTVNRKLCDLYKELVTTHRNVLELNKNINIEHVLKSETLYHIKTRFTIKMFGYNTIEEYLAAASIRDMIPSIKKPTLFLHAKDDVFQPIDCLVLKQFEKSNDCALVITNKGSHIGFMDNNHLPFVNDGEFYLERLFGQFFTGFNKLKNLEDLRE